jgi:sugar phosphate isomerase/epimerase
MKKVSLGSWAFAFGPYSDNPVPFDKTARHLADAGYDGIEVCGFPPHITLDGYPTKTARNGVKQFLDGLGLGVSGYAADLTAAPPLDKRNQLAYLDLFRQSLELCLAIGSPAIRVDSVSGPDNVPDGAFENTADIWRQAAGVAQQAGIRMVWEFEPGFAFNKPSEIVAMYERVAHPNFKIMFDTSHAYMCGVVGARQSGKKEILAGGVAEFLQMLDSRKAIGAIHLIDSDGSLHHDETSTHRPFGEGFVDFQSLKPKLLAVKGIDWWCIDLCFWAGSWEIAGKELEFVRKLLRS